MQLLCNVFLTDVKYDRAVTHTDRKAYERYLLPDFDQVEIFKYCLASWAVLPLTGATIYCKLDDNYSYRHKDIEDFIRQEFKCPVNYFPYRNEKQKDWQDVVSNLKDDVYFYMCNHDHVFIDRDLNVVSELINTIATRKTKTASFVSHWPEVLNVATQNGGKLCSENVIEFPWQTTSSVQFLTKDILEHWWFDHDYGDRLLPRPDWFFFTIKEVPATYLTTRRELFRHFDGYSLASIDPNRCPPLGIPKGFFEKNIQISFGKPDDNMTSIAPQIDKYRAIDPAGVDIIGDIHDMPYFWRNKISEETFYNFDENHMNLYTHRLNKARAKREYEHIPLEWIDVS